MAVFGWIADHATVASTIVSAVATATIAWFTISLARTTRHQLNKVGEQIDLARDEYMSSHRPKIKIHGIEASLSPTGSADDASIGARIIYFNTGDTDARLVKISGSITRRRLPLEAGLGLFVRMEVGSLPIPNDRVAPGQFDIVSIDSTYTVEGEKFAARSAEDNGRDGALMCIGLIDYDDGRGVCRRTGFCRRFESRQGRWTKMDNSEYEFAY